ncbi:MAG TPA: hypothetical protein VGN72_03335 [Tepidisphaeraceae bacterium]|jgi:hypothetical protein|nr:hypothetical protein [Tepidisphaeraceae bacterium]
MVDRVTADAIRIRPVQAGRPAAAMPRDRLEMVYIPVDRMPAEVRCSDRQQG